MEAIQSYARVADIGRAIGGPHPKLHGMALRFGKMFGDVPDFVFLGSVARRRHRRQGGGWLPGWLCFRRSDTSAPSNVLLFYVGHPGYDFNATCGVPVYAASDGTISYTASVAYPNGVDLNGENFHILELTPSGNPGYEIVYLHLASYPGAPKALPCWRPQVVPAGASVTAGTLIRYVGDAGLCGGGSPNGPCSNKAHLHFELQLNGMIHTVGRAALAAIHIRIPLRDQA